MPKKQQNIALPIASTLIRSKEEVKSLLEAQIEAAEPILSMQVSKIARTDLALLPQSITIAELLKIVVPALRIPKVESAIDDALKRKYEYLRDESIEMAKLMLLKYKLVETDSLVIQNEGAYTTWSVTPKALELWSTSIEL